MSEKIMYRKKWDIMKKILKNKYTTDEDKAFIAKYCTYTHEKYISLKKQIVTYQEAMNTASRIKKEHFEKMLNYKELVESLVDHCIENPELGKHREHRLIAQSMAKKIKSEMEGVES